ncbi:MAG: RDD family protein [Sulfuricaulis sp.]
MERADLEYVGFWLRVTSAIIDGLILGLICWPILGAVYGSSYWDPSGPMIKGPIDFIVSWVFPAIFTVVCWVIWQATPGKMAISARVVDANTGGKPSVGQCIARYLGYFVSVIPFCLGIIWVGLDQRKQGWHDKLAGTVVVRAKNSNPAAVRFDG